MEEIKYTIYRLKDPRTNDTMYVGLTFNNIKQRLRSHCSDKSGTNKSIWIQSLRKIGLKPIIESIESDISSYDEVCKKEIYYIEKYKLEGHKLTNMASGGSKNKKMSIQTRKKMSESAKNRKFKLILSGDTKKELSKKAKERFKDNNERGKLRIANKKYEDSKTDDQKLADILKQGNKFVLKYDKYMNFICEYPSIRDAERKTKINRSNIQKCCKGKVKSAGGYIWKFKH